MTDFERALALLLGHEGGLSDHALDRGGRTMAGVTQETFDDWRRRRGQPLADVATITDEQIMAVYRDLYWCVASCDRLPWPVNYLVFDAAVNSGAGRAVRWLQRGVGVAADGVAGPKTIAAARASGPAQWSAIVQARADFIADLIQGQPSQRAFLKGWMRRLLAVLTTALETKHG